MSLVLGIIGMHALSIGGVATDDADHSTVLSMTGSPGDMPAAAPDTGPMAAAVRMWRLRRMST